MTGAQRSIYSIEKYEAGVGRMTPTEDPTQGWGQCVVKDTQLKIHRKPVFKGHQPHHNSSKGDHRPA